jgi:methyl-accepting chemotaxis protein
MKMRKTSVLVSLLFVVFSIMVFLPPALADDGCSRDDVTKAVDEAVQILETQGADGLQQVGDMRFCGDNYVFVNNLKGKTLMHAKASLIGKVLIGLKDDQGKRFFADFTEVTKKSQGTNDGASYYNGAGWVEYRWPKPGEKTFSPKLSYIRGCLMGGENVYVGAGIYK